MLICMVKKIDFCKNGMTVSVSFWSKDFTITYYHPQYGLFKYGEHMMYMVPIVFTQEDIEKKASFAIQLFKFAESWLDKFGVLLEHIYENSEEIKKLHNDYLQGVGSDLKLHIQIYDEICLLVGNNSKLAHIISDYYFRNFIGLETVL